MKNLIKWVIWGILLLIIFSMPLLFMRTPGELAERLFSISIQEKPFATIIHIVFLSVMITGLIVKKLRDLLFSSFITLISLSATIFAVKHRIAPNIIIFSMFSVLIIHAYLTKKLNFKLKNMAPFNLVFSIMGMVFGFWYLHWVENPVWLNAFLYSPLGILNCPTMITVCGFLCMTAKPGAVMLEATVALSTLYFGFFGIFRLGAYVDITLIICALFLIFRLGFYLIYEDRNGERKLGR